VVRKWDQVTQRPPSVLLRGKIFASVLAITAPIRSRTQRSLHRIADCYLETRTLLRLDMADLWDDVLAVFALDDALVVANEWAPYVRSYTLLECYTKESRTRA
jgi:hypothetical protein